jgi:hypothetical protein
MVQFKRLLSSLYVVYYNIPSQAHIFLFSLLNTHIGFFMGVTTKFVTIFLVDYFCYGF